MASGESGSLNRQVAGSRTVAAMTIGNREENLISEISAENLCCLTHPLIGFTPVHD